MKQSEIEAKVGAKIDTENAVVNFADGQYSIALVGATLDETTLKPILVYEAEVPENLRVTEKKTRKPKAEAKPKK